MPAPSSDRDKEQSLPRLEPFKPACSELGEGRLRVLFQRAPRGKDEAGKSHR